MTKFSKRLLVFLFLITPVLTDASRIPDFRNAGSHGMDLQAITSEADLVTVPVTVTDRQGRSVSGLTEDDFKIYENGQLQAISLFRHDDIPVTVGLVIDCSGSMIPKRAEVAEAAKDFLVSSNPQDQVFVVNFNGKVSFGLPPLVPFTSNVAQLEEAVFKGRSIGLTALYDAIAAALNHVDLGTTDKKALLIISDGGDDASRDNFQQILTIARHSNVSIYAIGIVGDNEANVNPGLLRKLANATGGDAYFPVSAAEVPAICQQIARNLREQYMIAYIPSDRNHNGTYRHLRVSVHAPGRHGLLVRARAGYFASTGGDSGKPVTQSNLQSVSE